MLYKLLYLVVESVGGLFGSAMLLRAYMQWVRLGGRNPLSALVFALTDKVVIPLRRWIPGRAGIDWASLIGACVVAAVTVLVLRLVAAWTLGVGLAHVLHPVLMAVLVVLTVLRWAMYLVVVLTLLHVVMSWVNPYAPVAPAVGQLVAPLLAPLQRILPRMGGIDLSPLGLLLLAQIVLLLIDEAGLALPGRF